MIQTYEEGALHRSESRKMIHLANLKNLLHEGVVDAVHEPSFAA